MPTAFDATTSADLPSLFRPLWSLLDLLPVGAGAPLRRVKAELKGRRARRRWRMFWRGRGCRRCTTWCCGTAAA